MNISKLLGVACGAGLLFGHKLALADISITTSGATVNFTGYTGAVGFSPTPATGGLSSNDWAISGFSDGDLNFGSTNTALDYRRGATNPGTENGLYAWSATTGPMFGILPSDSEFSPGVVTARFKSAVNHPLPKIQVTYDVLAWNNTAISSTVKFSWSLNGSTFTAVGGALDYASPAAATTPVGSTAWVATNKTTTLTFNTPLAQDDLLYLRWTIDDASATAGDRDQLGLDNIVLTLPVGCGNGVNEGSPEECDDGNTSNADACLNTCMIAACGDGFVRTSGGTPEQCDGTVCCSNNCTRLTGTTCQGSGTCNNGVCVGGGQGGETGMAGDTGMGGEMNMAGDGSGNAGGEAGTAQGGTSGRGGRGGRSGMAGTDTGGTPGAGTGGSAAGTAGTATGGDAGMTGTAGTTATGGAGSGGTAGATTGGKGGSGGSSGKAGGSSAGTGAKPSGGSSGSSDDDSGCGCSVPRGQNHGTLALVAAGALATLMRRRRSRR
jgi:cysteine-rich repeat protein